MLSPHPADPTLTTDNLMEVMKGVEHRWGDLGSRLGVPESKMNEIIKLYHNVHQWMQALVDHYSTYHPTPSWKAVTEALQGMGLHKQADEVTTKYVKGMDMLRTDCKPDRFINGRRFINRSAGL